jgi:hypothetical protein
VPGMDAGKKNGFLDTEYSDAYSRVMLYGSSYFMKKIDKSILSGRRITFSTAHNKEKDYDIVQHAINFFGDAYVFVPQKNYLKKYDFSVVKVIIPSSYFFALDEIYSRPILKGINPKNVLINPFP